MWVCDHCLAAIESREGNQATLRHHPDEDDLEGSMCDWCEQVGFDTFIMLFSGGTSYGKKNRNCFHGHPLSDHQKG